MNTTLSALIVVFEFAIFEFGAGPMGLSQEPDGLKRAYGDLKSYVRGNM